MNCRIMSSTLSPVIIIPARMAASRLPGKPLADIAGKPMIQHVWERAVAANIAPVWVASDDDAIIAAVQAAGGNAVKTRADHPSGSDRTFEAVERIDPDRHFDMILNLQGDLPELDPMIPATLLATAQHSRAALSTLVTLADEDEAAKLISFGESKPDAGIEASELAAWTMLANMLMNLDEVVTK